MQALLFTDLRRHLHQLTHHHHSISASIYDTATVLRVTPPPDIKPALAWLLQMQSSDGGWGAVSIEPKARTVPTLAALLTLYKYRHLLTNFAPRLHCGISWLTFTASVWDSALPDDLPVGVELIVPYLLTIANTLEFPVPGSYPALIALGQKRKTRIAAIPFERINETTVPHSWESWGESGADFLWNEYNGIGCSPAATAVWAQQTTDSCMKQHAQNYLERASTATEVNCLGVVPTAFPITRFVQAYSLHTLALANLLDHPSLINEVKPITAGLYSAITPYGLGNTDGFLADGDDTAAALGVLDLCHYPVDLHILQRFACQDHFVSYVGELQPSVITSARATIVMQQLGATVSVYQDWITQRQLPDGSWKSDKWNGMWLYSTLLAILALRSDKKYHPHIQQAHDAIVQTQRPDGGWGEVISTAEATAYAILALYALPFHHNTTHLALKGGVRWLRKAYRPFELPNDRYWLAKERYTPFRLCAIVILCALVVSLDIEY